MWIQEHIYCTLSLGLNQVMNDTTLMAYLFVQYGWVTFVKQPALGNDLLISTSIFQSNCMLHGIISDQRWLSVCECVGKKADKKSMYHTY